MKKVFEVTYKGHHIQVINTWFSGEKLFVDGQLQDENLGIALRASLSGMIKEKDQTIKNIKVSLGGFLTIGCKIFVDNVLVFSK